MSNATVTVKPSGGDYTTLNAALSGESADLTANCHGTGSAGILTIECYAKQDTTGAGTGTGYTTSSAYYINIVAIDKHSGVRPGAEAYRLEISTGYVNGLYIQEAYTRVKGLALKATGTDGRGIRSDSASVQIIDCIAYDCYRQGLYLYSGGDGILNNCIALKCGDIGASKYAGIANYQSDNSYFCNCVSLNNGGNGIEATGGAAGHLTCINGYSGGNDGADYYKDAGTSLTLTTCKSEDGSEATDTAAYATGSGCYFDNVGDGTEDCNIGASSALKDAGTDIGAESYWVHPDGEVDIVGNARGATWDIGAFEYVAAGGVSASVSETLNFAETLD